MTDSPYSDLDEFVVDVSINIMLQCRCMVINNSAGLSINSIFCNYDILEYPEVVWEANWWGG